MLSSDDPMLASSNFLIGFSFAIRLRSFSLYFKERDREKEREIERQRKREIERQREKKKHREKKRERVKKKR